MKKLKPIRSEISKLIKYHNIPIKTICNTLNICEPTLRKRLKHPWEFNAENIIKFSELFDENPLDLLELQLNEYKYSKKITYDGREI